MSDDNVISFPTREMVPVVEILVGPLKGSEAWVTWQEEYVYGPRQIRVTPLIDGEGLSIQLTDDEVRFVRYQDPY